MPLAGLGMILLGITLITAGCLFFRRPGVGFTAKAPIWRSNEFLRVPGTLLWVVGTSFIGLGAALFFLAVSA